MRKATRQDTGHARWFMFIPDTGVFVIPAWVPVGNRVEYARNSGATRVRIEDREVWRDSEQVTSGPVRHLAVVR